MKRPKHRKIHYMDIQTANGATNRKPLCGAHAKTMVLQPSKVTCATCDRLFDERVAAVRKAKGQR